MQQPASWDYRFFESFIITVSETARFTFEDHTYAIPSKWIGQKVTVHTTNQTVSFLSLDTVIVSYKEWMA
ncbi:Mu transposase domain-containing protein [Anaerobiospirillum thomasii]|uniref:Mu transposase domain-containing protein n=1 Tax=Anaerobiospirillum thomasii TaxID=179995 RepID=UPI000DE5BF2C